MHEQAFLLSPYYETFEFFGPLLKNPGYASDMRVTTIIFYYLV